MSVDDYYAHTPGPSGEWHRLTDHLASVARLARERGELFGAGDLAYAIGHLHDFGKLSAEFQEYLRTAHEGGRSHRVPHAIWGAAFAYQALRQRFPQDWRQIALPIAGHHTGLAHGGKIDQDLIEFSESNPTAMRRLGEFVSTLRLRVRLPPGRLKGTELELFIRMLFSALVDADYLDTEDHFHPGQFAVRGGYPSLPELRDRFLTNQAEFTRVAREKQGATRVNEVRREVYEACLRAAVGPPGVYRLTVPTGGGKTRSGMAFALEHAVAHGLRRIVVAIPYTSIIDQNAREYRAILGDDAVIEHHSQVEAPDDESQDEPALRRRLATENWDAPIIVTTTVQLFESLFSNRPSKVRKIHNLARSVILLDEVQTLPPPILEPTTDALRSLVETFGCTLVLSTATQPALEDSPYLRAFHCLEVREIVEGYPFHFASLKRVRYEIRPDPIAWDDLASAIAERTQIMVVLNSRRDAIEVLKRLEGQRHVYHLSTLLCGAHRRLVLDQIRKRLDAELPVKLASTQVVEAGIDISFPSVWRAMGPLDRIVQAAGRCNRHGLLSEDGEVVIFKPAEGRAPSGPYKVAMLEAAAMLELLSPEQLHCQGTYREYFARVFAAIGSNLDERRIQPLREALDYPEVASRYRLITDETVPVVVNYGDSLRLLDQWERGRSRAAWQRLQPYVVNVYERDLRRLKEGGLVEELSDKLYYCGDYDGELLGLAQAIYDPADLSTYYGE